MEEWSNERMLEELKEGCKRCGRACVKGGRMDKWNDEKKIVGRTWGWIMDGRKREEWVDGRTNKWREQGNNDPSVP